MVKEKVTIQGIMKFLNKTNNWIEVAPIDGNTYAVKNRQTGETIYTDNKEVIITVLEDLVLPEE